MLQTSEITPCLKGAGQHHLAGLSSAGFLCSLAEALILYICLKLAKLSVQRQQQSFAALPAKGSSQPVYDVALEHTCDTLISAGAATKTRGLVLFR